MPEVPKPRTPTVYGERHEAGRRTPPRGYPRQDDVPVPFDQHEPHTGVHSLPETELLARTQRTQHVTEGIASTATSMHSRLGVVEGDVGAVKKDVKDLKDGQAAQALQITTLEATVVQRFDAQDKYLKPLVDMATSNAVVNHKAKVERGTAGIKTALAWLSPSALLAVLGFLAARHC